ncbi:hypothetical protein [Oceanibaculum nanhaiense]|uniref:hypothetical protein n=1 Tax=Oceanibaculum nanhaiense TaxID=1909734 RepID=UPI003D2730E7
MRGFAYKLCRTLFIVATVVFLALAGGSCVMMWREVDPGATDQQTGLLALGWAVGMIPVFFVWMVVAVPLYLLARMFRSGEDLRLVGSSTTERQDPKL